MIIICERQIYRAFSCSTSIVISNEHNRQLLKKTSQKLQNIQSVPSQTCNAIERVKRPAEAMKALDGKKIRSISEVTDLAASAKFAN